MSDTRARRVVAGLAAFLAALLLSGIAVEAQKARKEPPAEPLDLNRATVEQLMTLPEVGPSVARAIVRFREKSGPFRRVEDLLAVRGITKRRLEKIRPYVTVSGQPKSEGTD